MRPRGTSQEVAQRSARNERQQYLTSIRLANEFVDCVAADAHRLALEVEPAPFLDLRDSRVSRDEAVRGLLGEPGLVLLVGPAAVGKSHLLGQLMRALVRAERPFVTLHAQQLDVSAPSLGEAVAEPASRRPYPGPTHILRSLIECGDVLVIIDGVEEIGRWQGGGDDDDDDDDDQPPLESLSEGSSPQHELAQLIGAHFKAEDQSTHLVVAVRPDTNDFLDQVSNSVPHLRRTDLRVLTPDEFRDRIGTDAVVPRWLSEAIETDDSLRTPLVASLIQDPESGIGSEHIQTRRGSDALATLWRQYVDARLPEERAPVDWECLTWVAWLVKRVLPGPLIEPQNLVPEWLADEPRRLSARRWLVWSGLPVFLVATIPWVVLWEGLFGEGRLTALLAWAAVGAVVVSVYAIRPDLAIAESRALPRTYERRATSVRTFRQKLTTKGPELKDRLQKDLFAGLTAGFVLLGLWAPLVDTQLTSGWGLVATIAFGGLAMILVGGRDGTMWGTLTFAAALGLGADADQLIGDALLVGAAIGLISGLATGLVLMYFDEATIDVYPKIGGQEPLRVLRRTWLANIIYETNRWMSFGLFYALLATLLAELAPLDPGWFWWGVIGGAAGAVLYGVIGGSFPTVNYWIAGRFVRRDLEGRSQSLVEQLDALADAKILVRLGDGYAYRLRHSTLADALEAEIPATWSDKRARPKPLGLNVLKRLRWSPKLPQTRRRRGPD